MRFAVCYHFAIKSGIFKPKVLCLCGFSDFTIYSHSVTTLKNLSKNGCFTAILVLWITHIPLKIIRDVCKLFALYP